MRVDNCFLYSDGFVPRTAVRFASLRSLPTSAKTVHRTVFFRRSCDLLPPCSNPYILQTKKKAPTIKVSAFLTFTGYSAPSIFRLLRAVSEKSSLLETCVRAQNLSRFCTCVAEPQQTESESVSPILRGEKMRSQNPCKIGKTPINTGLPRILQKIPLSTVEAP